MPGCFDVIITGSSSVIAYQLIYVNSISWTRRYVTTYEWEVDDWKVEIITFVVDPGVK